MPYFPSLPFAVVSKWHVSIKYLTHYPIDHSYWCNAMPFVLPRLFAFHVNAVWQCILRPDSVLPNIATGKTLLDQICGAFFEIPIYRSALAWMEWSPTFLLVVVVSQSWSATTTVVHHSYVAAALDGTSLKNWILSVRWNFWAHVVPSLFLASASTWNVSLKYRTILKFPLALAMCNTVLPSSFVSSESTPQYSIPYCSIIKWPYRQAWCNGVSPKWYFA